MHTRINLASALFAVYDNTLGQILGATIQSELADGATDCASEWTNCAVWT